MDPLSALRRAIRSHLQIQNLIVTTPDGTTCVDQSNQTSTQAFQLTVIRG